MKEMITAADKKQFIQWFLEHYELKNPESEWLLQYLCSSEQLLARVHFTDQFRNSPKALLMSTTCVQMTAFKFYKNKRVTSDVEKAFLDVHNHPEEDVYVTLYFRDRANSARYKAVVEAQSETRYTASTLEVLHGLIAELWLDRIAQEYRESVLRKRIDDALLAKNEKEFYESASELCTLLQQREI
ncbi:IDEAL domain protein [Ferroacidibacillus organovorans]|uniref:IDEAL domain protein n=2 Tax=Ferroacidibacillus organovorans TaxID=1765683 RepID=A0A161QG13_9BACL|nr:IDEAL domain protein [Ferroacidibacillus organovorans]OAG93675.1 IDEAL domain protein [Ferroacidibacillus organovorans]OPG16663.1 IDEAL domain protein [Ferroacidibacillus organovorans]